MQSITKSAVSERSIHEIVRNTFGQKAEEITELTEGFFNIAYSIRLKDKEVVLKIAPPVDAEIMTHEKGIMRSEVEAMKMAADRTQVPVPAILFYDDSRTLIDRDYFFMEKLKGRSFSTVRERMTQEEQKAVTREIGVYTAMLNGITGSSFGYYGQKDKQGKEWYPVFRSMLQDEFDDAERMKVRLPLEKEAVLALLEQDEALFEEVETPRFVHWDIWAGNVFVKGGRIEGIIDFERCLWADPLMEVGFRIYECDEAFFDGYGIQKLTAEQARRARWYDIYLFLIMAQECDYRQYEGRDSYEWACGMLEKCYALL